MESREEPYLQFRYFYDYVSATEYNITVLRFRDSPQNQKVKTPPPPHHGTSIPSAMSESASNGDDSRIPIIDFDLFLNGTDEQKGTTSAQINDAFHNVGFVYLTNHGVPREKVDECFQWVGSEITKTFLIF